jgi:hypothetical protein
VTNWLPDMDLNHDKQIQSLLCYRYTIGQTDVWPRLGNFTSQSSQQPAAPQGQMIIAHGFNRGSASQNNNKPRRGDRTIRQEFCRASGTRFASNFYPRLKPWAILVRPAGAVH